MWRSLVLVVVMLFMSFPATAQLKVTKIYSVTDAEQFRTADYDEVLTRGNSFTVTVSDFAFPEIKNGTFVVYLRLALEELSSSGPAVPKREIRMLFDDVIQDVKANDPVRLSLKNKTLASSLPLSGVNNVHVDVRLVKVRNEYGDFKKLLQPILNVTLSNNAIFGVVDNVLESVSTGKNDSLLFSSDFHVPANVFEYKRLRETGALAMLNNNQPFAIFLNGTTPVPDDSLLGKAGTLVNAATRFVKGKEVIPQATAQYSGLVRLFFTKDATPVLPAVVEEALRSLEANIMGPTVTSDADVIRVQIRDASRLASAAQRNGQIDDQTNFSVQEYLKLAQIYLAMSTAATTDNGWQSSFGTWALTFDTRGVASGAQAIGVTGVYADDRYAKIYLPYSLSDDRIMSFYVWQVTLHKTLQDQNVTKHAIRLSPQPSPSKK